MPVSNLEKNKTKYLLKLSGEILGSEREVFAPQHFSFITSEIKKGFNPESNSLAIVVGGGNIARGREIVKLGLGHVPSDYAGMLSTVINGILLSEYLKLKSIKSVVFSALPVANFVRPYKREEALTLYNNGTVVIFTLGSGLPFFSTDTVSAVRAAELNADFILKGTKVDGVYNRDPDKYKNAEFLKHITFEQAIKSGLHVMDQSAFAIAMERNIPIMVFNILKEGNLSAVLSGVEIGSIVKGGL